MLCNTQPPNHRSFVTKSYFFLILESLGQTGQLYLRLWVGLQFTHASALWGLAYRDSGCLGYAFLMVAHREGNPCKRSSVCIILTHLPSAKASHTVNFNINGVAKHTLFTWRGTAKLPGRDWDLQSYYEELEIVVQFITASQEVFNL